MKKMPPQGDIPAIFQREKSANLFDLNSPNNVTGYYVNFGTPAASSNFMYSHLIPITNGSTYTYPIYYGMFGTNAARLQLFDSSGNYIANINGTPDNGTLNASSKYSTVTVSNASAAYARVNVAIQNYSPFANAFMFIKGSTYPSVYELFSDKYVLPHASLSSQTLSNISPLYGKVAVFDGDSICNGSSANDSKSGWAGRIGAKHRMDWTNYAVGGATITAGVNQADGTTPRHWVSRTIDTMRSDADYIILEGGTNDADLLSAGQIGTISTGYTAALDDTTFCGAVESLFKKAIAKYPGKKIGFIIAPKMGVPVSTNRRAKFDLIVQMCQKWGIPYLDLWNGSCLNPDISQNNTLMYTDGQHLTSAGYDYITQMIEAWMKTL